MTAACTQTLYAPNPPQLDAWLKTAIALIALVLIAALAAGG